jgi:hypothetical protein
MMRYQILPLIYLKSGPRRTVYSCNFSAVHSKYLNVYRQNRAYKQPNYGL